MLSALPAGAPAPRLSVAHGTLRDLSLYLMVFGGGVVLIEPSPFEVFGALALLVWAATGALRYPRELVPVTVLLALSMIGALVTLVPVLDRKGTVLWTEIGWFMAATGLFFAVLLADDTERRLALVVRAYTASALVGSLVAIAAYFHAIPFSDSFLLYGRAAGPFKDPNVFGPFLVFPGLVEMQRLLVGDRRRALASTVRLAVLVVALLLTFSRGAWGHFAASAVLMAVLTLVCTRSPALRLRVVLLCLGGVAALALLLLGLVSIPAVQHLFAERASLDQSYDVGHYGRFNRWSLGFVLALDRPIGIGMLQFSTLFGEEPHNSYLNAFMAYGWLGGIVYPAIVVATCVAGWRTCLRPSPWRPTFICAMATFQVVVLEAWVISLDHWRHFWLLFGMVWGLSVATSRLYRRRRQRPSPPLAALAPA